MSLTVPANTDYSRYKLVFSDGQEIPLASILEVAPGSLLDATKEKDLRNFIGGGEDNIASGVASVIAGGDRNSATAIYTSIGGGYLNASNVAYSAIGGGRENTADYYYCTIGGGYANYASGRNTTIGGGSRNTANFNHATIGGGIRNLANASDTTIAGGAYNTASDTHATICGGTQNVASGTGATVCGGAGNVANANHATLGGGLGNEVAGTYATVSGGRGNLAAGTYSVIPGGLTNQTYSDYSFASGYRSIISHNHPGTFLFADATDADFLSEEANEFAVRATGGVRFISAVGADGTPLSGVFLPSGSGSWSTLSDKNRKERFSSINEMEILKQVLRLPISEWSYISEKDSVRHIGPMAQDFYSAFELGSDERYISSVDSDGVALAAIQGLHQLVSEKDAIIEKQQSQLDILELRVVELENQKRTGSFFSIWIMLGSFAIYHYCFARKFLRHKGSS